MSAKRRRVSSQCRQSAEEYDRYTLNTLPPEVLGIILKMLPLHDVACVVRLISRRYSDIAATVLNSEFLVAGTKLEIAIKRTEDLMNNAQTDRELLEYNKNALELIRCQYRMLKAVTWRYTYPRSRSLPVSCFYGGRILDNLNYLLQTVFNPRRESRAVNIDYHMCDLQIFIRNCENFMDHFERVTERRLNRSALVSGCKIVDVLDCLEEGRQVLSVRISPRTENPMVSMHLKYVLRRAWFTCLRVPNAGNESYWRDKQRYMYLRLRRLVGSYNKHLFHTLYYERKLVLHAVTPSPRRPPPASTYSGYGEYGGQFFYYGNMSKYAYENKFKHTGSNNASNTNGEFEDESNRPPCFDLIIGVQLRCSPELAPLAAGINLKTDNLEGYSANSHQELYLKLNIKCAVSKTNRLPDIFTWEIRGPRKNLMCH